MESAMYAENEKYARRVLSVFIKGDSYEINENSSEERIWESFWHLVHASSKSAEVMRKLDKALCPLEDPNFYDKWKHEPRPGFHIQYKHYVDGNTSISGKSWPATIGGLNLAVKKAQRMIDDEECIELLLTVSWFQYLPTLPNDYRADICPIINWKKHEEKDVPLVVEKIIGRRSVVLIILKIIYYLENKGII